MFLATCIKSGAILQPQAFFQRQNPPNNRSKSVGQGRCFEPLFLLPEAGSRPSDKIFNQKKNWTYFQAKDFKGKISRRPGDLSDSSIVTKQSEIRHQKDYPPLSEVLRSPPSYIVLRNSLIFTIFSGAAPPNTPITSSYSN